MKRLTNNEFILKANIVHNNIYDYSKIKYKNMKTKITIICLKHGDFLQSPDSHIHGTKCPKCSNKNKPTNNEFIEKANKIHNNKYDYGQLNYTNNHTKIIIICPNHGKFLQRPNDHMKGNGCPHCVYKISKSSDMWLDEIEDMNNIKLEREYHLNINGQQFFIDGFNLVTNTCYEYNGNFWHGNPKIFEPSDINPMNKITYGELYQQTLRKEKIIKSAGYNLITKWGN